MRYLTLAEGSPSPGPSPESTPRLCRGLPAWNCSTQRSAHPKLVSVMSSSIPNSWTRQQSLWCVSRETIRYRTATSAPGLATTTMFYALNGHELRVPRDEAVSTMLAIAAGELDEAAVADWLTERLDANTL